MNTSTPTIDQMPVNEDFAARASNTAIERAAATLRAHKFEVFIVPDAAGAKELVLRLIPEGSEVGQGASVTMDDLGLTELIEKSGKYDALRPRTRVMDRATQGREIRKLSAAPDFFLSSAQALTQDGSLVFVSATGSQIGPIAFAAGRLILVVGAQKIVPDLETALARIREYAYPIEDAKMHKLYGVGSAMNRILILAAEGREGRTTVIIVREPVGT
jgi:hypothetical protein